ncbi:MAG: hypothetical protein JW891_03210 [Candidatus Lokiarchaeota archaeon]|nr:hypothetical protein [Candidatus Lokiarchaeota archaeon]
MQKKDKKKLNKKKVESDAYGDEFEGDQEAIENLDSDVVLISEETEKPLKDEDEEELYT